MALSAMTLETGFMIALSAVIGRRCGLVGSARSMMTSWTWPLTSSRTQMYFSDSIVSEAKLMNCGWMPMLATLTSCEAEAAAAGGGGGWGQGGMGAVVAVVAAVVRGNANRGGAKRRAVPHRAEGERMQGRARGGGGQHEIAACRREGGRLGPRRRRHQQHAPRRRHRRICATAEQPGGGAAASLPRAPRRRVQAGRLGSARRTRQTTPRHTHAPHAQARCIMRHVAAAAAAAALRHHHHTHVRHGGGRKQAAARGATVGTGACSAAAHATRHPPPPSARERSAVDAFRAATRGAYAEQQASMGTHLLELDRQARAMAEA